MPTTYAHWRFGQDCIDLMSEDLKKIVNNNREIYDIGVHGPDIFFYDLKHHDVSSYGDLLHTKPVREFFTESRKVYLSHEEKEMMLSYLLGFLSHFTLDSQCHSYVERKKEVSNVSHNKIEAEWDVHVMKLDNKKVNKVDRSASLKPNKKIAEVLANFFPFDEKTMLGTTKGQNFLIGVLNYRTQLRYKTLFWLCKKLNLNDYADLLLYPEELETCADSNLRLDKLRENARSIYPELLKSFMEFMNEDKPLPEYFNHHFERWEDYKDIPVLSKEEELNYSVK